MSKIIAGTIISAMAFGAIVASASPITIQTCSGKEGGDYKQVMTLVFAPHLPLESKKESTYVLSYAEFFKGRLLDRFEKRGTGAVSEVSSDKSRIVLNGDAGKWVGDIEIDHTTLQASLTFKDFGLEPTDPQAPPITHTIGLMCTRGNEDVNDEQ